MNKTTLKMLGGFQDFHNLLSKVSKIPHQTYSDQIHPNQFDIQVENNFQKKNLCKINGRTVVTAIKLYMPTLQLYGEK